MRFHAEDGQLTCSKKFNSLSPLKILTKSRKDNISSSKNLFVRGKPLVCQRSKLVGEIFLQLPSSTPSNLQIGLPFLQQPSFLSHRDPGSPSENGFMEPKYNAEEVIGHPNHLLRIWLDA